MNADIKTKRELINKFHGGSESFDDSQINIVWQSLTEIDRQRYLDSIKPKPKEKEVKHADRNATE